MTLGKVVGSVWATKKDDSLSGYKLMVVEPLNQLDTNKGEAIVAVDTIGAGVGDVVLVCRGSAARQMYGKTVDAPIDAAIVGIVDEIEGRDW